MVPEVKALASQVWQPKFGTQVVEAENWHTWKMTYMCIMACLCPSKHKINKLIKNQHQSDIWACGFRNSLLWLLQHCGSWVDLPINPESPWSLLCCGCEQQAGRVSAIAEHGLIPMVGMAERISRAEPVDLNTGSRPQPACPGWSNKENEKGENSRQCSKYSKTRNLSVLNSGLTPFPVLLCFEITRFRGEVFSIVYQTDAWQSITWCFSYFSCLQPHKRINIKANFFEWEGGV